MNFQDSSDVLTGKCQRTALSFVESWNFILASLQWMPYKFHFNFFEDVNLMQMLAEMNSTLSTWCGYWPLIDLLHFSFLLVIICMHFQFWERLWHYFFYIDAGIFFICSYNSFLFLVFLDIDSPLGILYLCSYKLPLP